MDADSVLIQLGGLRESSMVTETELEAFVAAATHYFASSVDAASIGSPYLVEDGATPMQEFTGSIKISGKRCGVVYFSASRLMLTSMLVRMGETEITLENMIDLVGEVANTLSGNVRREFGSEFMISVPTVQAGKGERPILPTHIRSYVVPIQWRGHAAQLVLNLE